MYHVSAQGVDERMINVHYYYYWFKGEQQLLDFMDWLNDQHPTIKFTVNYGIVDISYHTLMSA